MVVIVPALAPRKHGDEEVVAGFDIGVVRPGAEGVRQAVNRRRHIEAESQPHPRSPKESPPIDWVAGERQRGPGQEEGHHDAERVVYLVHRLVKAEVLEGPQLLLGPLRLDLLRWLPAQPAKV